MTQVSNKGCTLFEDSREGVEPRLRGEAIRGLHRLQGRLYGVLCSRALGVSLVVRGEDCWVLLLLWEAQSKVIRALEKLASLFMKFEKGSDFKSILVPQRRFGKIQTNCLDLNWFYSFNSYIAQRVVYEVEICPCDKQIVNEIPHLEVRFAASRSCFKYWRALS